MTDVLLSPKVFLSYSWTSPAYGERVVALAVRLREAGVDVVLDRAHLTGGQDANAFMERSVTDPSITHVLLLCDPRYAERADGREGGVGTETLIVSPQVYKSATQSKFIPVIMERDDAGEVRLPTYAQGRIWYDLSNPEKEQASFEQLLRHVYGKPEVVLPPLGKRPAFLDDAEEASFPTRQPAAALRAALVSQRPNRWAALEEYLSTLGGALTDIRTPEGLGSVEDVQKFALGALEALLPLRDEFVSTLQVLLRYADEERTYQAIHRFFEQVANLIADRAGAVYDVEYVAPHRGFLVREIVLHTVAVLLEAEQFEGLNRILGTYYVSEFRGQRGDVRTIGTLDANLRVIDEIRGYYPGNVAGLLARRADGGPVTPRQVREAEVLCCVRSRLEAASLGKDYESRGLWYPAASHHGFQMDDLPMIARLRDPRYRERFARALGANGARDLAARVARLPELPQFGHPLAWTSPEPLSQLLHLSQSELSAHN